MTIPEEQFEVTQIHEHGHVALDDHMGGDLAIVNNARVSFNDDTDTMDERNAGLIGFLDALRQAYIWRHCDCDDPAKYGESYAGGPAGNCKHEHALIRALDALEDHCLGN